MGMGQIYWSTNKLTTLLEGAIVAIVGQIMDRETFVPGAASLLPVFYVI